MTDDDNSQDHPEPIAFFPVIPYDPDFDNCRESPECGTERAFIRWYGAPLFACPRCFENVFGEAPEADQIITIEETDKHD